MKILLITNQLKTVTIISNFITLNIDNNISTLIANNLEAANLILSEHNINLIIWEKAIFNLDYYTDNLYYIPVILVNDICNYDEIFLKRFNCISLDNLTDLPGLLDKYISSFNVFKNTKKRILNELIFIGFNLKHRGTKYMTESILFFKYYYKSDNIQDIYSIIARKHHTTSNNIKSNILNSIKYMYFENDFSKLKTYFSLVEDVKPTPKQIVLTVLKKI